MTTEAEHPAHDPEPWLTYTMQTGSAGGWKGQPRFAPRSAYCQNKDCYTTKYPKGTP